jgi:hypothetical protein
MGRGLFRGALALGVLLALAIAPAAQAGPTEKLVGSAGTASTFFCYSGNFCGAGYPSSYDVSGFDFKGRLVFGDAAYEGLWELSPTTATYIGPGVARLGTMTLRGHSKLGTVKGTCGGIVTKATARTLVNLACTGYVVGSPQATTELRLELTSGVPDTDELTGGDGPTCVCSSLIGIYLEPQG